MKKIISLILALVMVMGLAVTASAADDTGFSISITAPAGVDTVKYNVYKVFNATTNEAGGITYTLVDGKTTVPTGFSADPDNYVTYNGTGSELSETEIEAIKNYVTEADKVADITLTGGATGTVSLEAAGYYYISTASGSVVAINSAKPTAEVTDKNTIPTLEKKIVGGESDTSTTVAIGDVVKYELTITIPENATGTLTVYDQLDANFRTASFTNVNNPNFNYFSNGGQLGLSFWTLNNSENYAGQELTITYELTVPGYVPADVELKNTAWLAYGGHLTAEQETAIITRQMDVEKVDGEGNPLEGAKFKLKNEDGQYYTVDSDGNVSWTADGTEVEAELVDGNYVANFKGLNGTYTLEESTVPPGYNKAADQDITITDASLTGEDAIPVVNLSGSELPSTGGMGTTLFYVIGGLMMACAAVILITKRRVA